jgi:hypothetical protein
MEEKGRNKMKKSCVDPGGKNIRQEVLLYNRDGGKRNCRFSVRKEDRGRDP